MSITGRTYLERGKPVTVETQWAVTAKPAPGQKHAPRNVLIRRENGTRAVRPLRGLRRIPEGGAS